MSESAASRVETDLTQLNEVRLRISQSDIDFDGGEAHAAFDLMAVLEEIWTYCGANLCSADDDAPTPVLDVLKACNVEFRDLEQGLTETDRELSRRELRRNVSLTSTNAINGLLNFTGEEPPLAMDQFGNSVDFGHLSVEWLRSLRATKRWTTQLEVFERAAARTAEFQRELTQAKAQLSGITDAVRQQSKLAKDAANLLANQDLSTHFSGLARGELRTATIYRGSALAVIGVAVASAIVVGESWKTPHTYLPAMALTLVAIYLARLAGPHFHLGKWAASVEVQLKSFEGFCGVVDDTAVREQMRAEFGRRVLGPPPNFDSATEPVPGLTVADVVQIATALQRK